MDCGSQICLRTALYGNGRCKICANLGKLNPRYNIQLFGENNAYWKGGKPKCLDCNKQLIDYRAKRCEICCSKNRKNKPRGGRSRFGEQAPYYKDGRSLKDKFCIDCNIKLSSYRCKRCYCCWAKSNTDKNNANYCHGQGYKSYPIVFNNRLKNDIRKRDRFECQRCKISNDEHEQNFNQILHVHHIDYNKNNCNETNLITTCRKCNIQANFNRDYWFAYYTYLIAENIQGAKI